jgi:uncharacterized protein
MTTSAGSPSVPSSRSPLLVRCEASLRRPFLLWFCYLVSVTAIALVAKSLWPQVTPGPSGVSALQVGLQMVLTLLILPFAAALGRQRVGLGSRLGKSWGPILVFPAMTIAVGYLPGLRPVPMEFVLLAVASVILAGVSEELAFRGVLLHLFADRAVWFAVLVSSALFGLTHASNLALGASVPGTILQITFSAMAGVGYAALRLRTGSLWPCIALHAVYDLIFRVGNIEPGSVMQYTVFMLHGLGWAIYGVVVLRPSKLAHPLLERKN